LHFQEINYLMLFYMHILHNSHPDTSVPVVVKEEEHHSFFTCTAAEVIPLIISVNMSDYLEVTLSKNRKYFSQYIIVTCHSDTKTKDICKKYNVRVIEYDNFFPQDSKFNKSGAMRHAQQIIHREYPNNWVLIMDTDIVLPKNITEILNGVVNKNKNILYGIDRYEVMNTEELNIELRERKYGCSFVGYFQLYFDKTKYYDTFSYNASKCDSDFSKKFRHKTMLESNVFHLGIQGAHWNGRTTKEWK